MKMVYGKRLLWIPLIFIILAVWFALWLLAEPVFAQNPCDNRPPTFSPARQDVERNVGAAAGVGLLYWVGRFPATDPDGDTLTYSLGGSGAGRFQIDSRSGTLRVGHTIIGCEEPKLSVQIIASDRIADDPCREQATLNLTIDIICSDSEPVIEPPTPVVDPPITTMIVEADEIVEILEKVEETTEEVEIEVPEPLPPPEPVYERVNWNFQFYRYWNLVTMPVIPEGVVTIADLYDHWTFFRALNAQIIFLVDGRWVLYTGDRAQPAGEIPLRRHMGLVVRLDSPSFLGVVRGTRFYNAERLVLQPGLNLLGFHQLPVGIERPSDLLRGPVYAVIVTKEGKFMLVGRADDPGDEPLGIGQAMIVMTSGPAVIDTLTGKIMNDSEPATPQATQ